MEAMEKSSHASFLFARSQKSSPATCGDGPTFFCSWCGYGSLWSRATYTPTRIFKGPRSSLDKYLAILNSCSLRLTGAWPYFCWKPEAILDDFIHSSRHSRCLCALLLEEAFLATRDTNIRATNCNSSSFRRHAVL
ncbi:hypothetical protein P8C59_000647 [Phyllachora maydis]|uniref:Uncharacterized protein n=1 Tax=Phyllachora maydis TaxID=1825666 RepID=A0AAD9HY32_9PEZI|nr:hypothetical protein P8C59_000647 [Phyllachora maydis]